MVDKNDPYYGSPQQQRSKARCTKGYYMQKGGADTSRNLSTFFVSLGEPGATKIGTASALDVVMIEHRFRAFAFG